MNDTTQASEERATEGVDIILAVLGAGERYMHAFSPVLQRLGKPRLKECMTPEADGAIARLVGGFVLLRDLASLRPLQDAVLQNADEQAALTLTQAAAKAHIAASREIAFGLFHLRIFHTGKDAECLNACLLAEERAAFDLLWADLTGVFDRMKAWTTAARAERKEDTHG